jgi:fatty acid desaturase
MTETLGPERIIYIALFGIGLLTGVYSMLNGSVRFGRDRSKVKAPPAAFNAPVVGMGLLVLGGAGYAISVYSHTDTIPTLLIATLVAACAWIGMTVLMAKWALNGPVIDPHEEMEELQGTIAIVTSPIVLGTPGEISYVFRGERLKVAARNIGSDVVGVGTEVVIEKIKDGIADVELWSIVEQRL